MSKRQQPEVPSTTGVPQLTAIEENGAQALTCELQQLRKSSDPLLSCKETESLSMALLMVFLDMPSLTI
ncbi:hypothetical protein [Billgrantia desiderata]|uniref:hypothetical protein n=1 Tax=Billgrantia desiderata TaxID=52021 RepID=UPI00111DC608|nr:hypothetical protein [Halomonas desiderata]